MSETAKLPAGALQYLRADNPKLADLRARYAALNVLGRTDFGHTQWAPEVLRHQLELSQFRADNAYTWQVRGGMEEIHYVLTAYYVKDADKLGLFERLKEDDLFGPHTFDFNGRQTISRDFLDSILQINFLNRHMKLASLPRPTVLDIGAGYGRLAHRMAFGLPNLGVIWSTDAIPESTFLCDYYLRFRGAGERAVVIPLDEIQASLKGTHIDVVTNVQSFTECTTAAIAWWLKTLQTAQVDYLMIVPNSPDQLLSMEPDGSRLDFQPLVESFGFRLIAKEYAYLDAPSVQRLGVYGTAKYWLFQHDAG